MLFGKDPYNMDVPRENQNKNFLDFHHRMKEHVNSKRPGYHVDFNDTGIGKVSERIDFLDNIDIEALPTGGLKWPFRLFWYMKLFVLKWTRFEDVEKPHFSSFGLRKKVKTIPALKFKTNVYF